MKDMKIEQGEVVDILIEDKEAVKARLLVSKTVDDTAIIDVEESFTDGKAQITLLNAQTDKPVGDYVYQIRLYDADNEYIVLDGDCDDCTLAKFVICPVIKGV